MNDIDLLGWQALSFIVVGALGLLLVLCSVFVSRISSRRERVLLTIGLSALVGSIAGVIGTQYMAHYLTCVIMALGSATVVADVLMTKFRLDPPPPTR